ncbi:DNA/RNA-binding protein KIN17 [Prorops nasuta]|uniref:DNA/RNA-binding protein KIN17 n=1 Tax=Prorops nasuta TaxID=863751 RepID=UPI0034CE5F92
MGKHEVGTPKYIANKIKAKGLQKLRWYCQMCQKQCRDENGFKCHTMSESHHRQLLLFADNAGKYMDQFSKEFSDGYLDLLRRQFGTKRVPANRVYQDYIADRTHIHMNATKWLSLTAYVKWLGRTGKCVVDETEKGWFVTYIDRDPETLAAQEKKAKREKLDKDDEKRMMDFIEKQVEIGKQKTNELPEDEKVPLVRPENDTPLVLELNLKPKFKPLPLLQSVLKKEVFKKPGNIKESNNSSERNLKKKSLSEDEKILKKIKAEPESSIDEEGWLREGLAVKVVTKSLGQKYYKAKGIVQGLVENSGFVAKVKIKTPENVAGAVIKLDQEHLETVIPAIGRKVIVLWGSLKGQIGIVKKLHIDDYNIDVELKDKVIKKFPYEQVCKYVEK